MRCSSRYCAIRAWTNSAVPACMLVNPIPAAQSLDQEYRTSERVVVKSKESRDLSSLDLVV